MTHISHFLFKYAFVVLLLYFSTNIYSQDLGWTWISGSDTINESPVYGTKGVADPANIPQGRMYSTSWTDSNGIFWLFGGWGKDVTDSIQFLNDLWKYDPATNLWTWVSGSNYGAQVGNYGTKGVEAATNMPCSRHFNYSWIDSNDNLWIFGGYFRDSQGGYNRLNDLWRYNPVTNMWTWMSGDNTYGHSGNYGTKGIANANNRPGGRVSGVSWIDSNDNLWLYAGVGQTTSGYWSWGRLNDLWKYNTTTNMWTWVSGTTDLNPHGVYGTKGIASQVNIPGGREHGYGWIDNSNNLWYFGGQGYGASGGYDGFNDLWKYNITANTWTWVYGDSIGGAPTVRGIKGFPAASNDPGASSEGCSLMYENDNLWFFAGNYQSRMDLWRYNITTGLWTWMLGNSYMGQIGNYGTKGVSSPSNVLGTRWDMVSFVDLDNQIYIFGGLGKSTTSTVGYLNDLWKCEPLNFINVLYGGLYRHRVLNFHIIQFGVLIV